MIFSFFRFLCIKQDNANNNKINSKQTKKIENQPMKQVKNAIIKKAHDFKKQNCSAPFTLTVFLITSLIIIFSFESIGLLRKEKNLDYRINSPEISIKLMNLEKYEEQQKEVSLADNSPKNIFLNSKNQNPMNKVNSNRTTIKEEGEDVDDLFELQRQRIDLMESLILQGAIENELSHLSNYDEEKVVVGQKLLHHYNEEYEE